MVIHCLQTGTSDALLGKTHAAGTTIFLCGDGVMAVCQGDKGDRLVTTLKACCAGYGQTEISAIALAHPTCHGGGDFCADRAILGQERLRDIQQLLERGWLMGHYGGSKVPSFRQHGAQLMPYTAAESGFGYGDGEIMLPNEIGHGLFVFHLVGAKHGFAQPLAHLLIEGINQGGGGSQHWPLWRSDARGFRPVAFAPVAQW